MIAKIQTTPEIPDEWWTRSGMDQFAKNTRAYPTTYLNEIVIISISEIRPIQRSIGTPAFHEQRMLDILLGFARQSAIPPIIVEKNTSIEGFKYELLNGVHRYYASIAAGFDMIPVVFGKFIR